MWYYNNKPYNEIHDPKAIGFVYKITNISNGMEYIGMKLLYATTNKRMGKKAIANLPDKRLSKKIKTVKESNWKVYNSSSKIVQEEIKQNPQNFKKEIISFHYTKKQLSYAELKALITNDVLSSDKYYNQWISVSKYFRRDFL